MHELQNQTHSFGFLTFNQLQTWSLIACLSPRILGLLKSAQMVKENLRKGEGRSEAKRFFVRECKRDVYLQRKVSFLCLNTHRKIQAVGQT